MTLRALLLLLSITLLSACGGSSPDPVPGPPLKDCEDGQICDSVFLDIRSEEQRNWIGVEGEATTIELVAFVKKADETDFDEMIKGDIYWSITKGSEYASIEQNIRRAVVTAKQKCPDDNPYCVTVEAKIITSTAETIIETVNLLVKENSDNFRPQANAGNDQTVTGGDTVSLDGSASFDLDGYVTNYSWSVLSGPLTEEQIAGINTATPSFIAPESKYDQIIVLKLVVTDTDGGTGTKQITVSISPTIPNTPPVATILNIDDGQTFITGQEIPLNGRFSDDDSTAEQCRWGWSMTDPAEGGELTPIGEAIEDCSQNDDRLTGSSFRPELASVPGELYLVLEVTDLQGEVNRAIRQLTITPVPEGNPPVTQLTVTVNPEAANPAHHSLSSNGAAELSLELNEGATICLDLGDSTAEKAGNSLTYSWVNTENLNAIAPQAETKRCFELPAKTTPVRVSLLPGVTETYSDKELQSSVTVNLTILPVPAITAVQPSNGAVNQKIKPTLMVQFSDENMNCHEFKQHARVIDTNTGAAINRGDWSCGANRFDYALTEPLDYHTTYRIEVDSQAVNSAGNPLPANYSSTFTTAPQVEVESWIPAPGSDNIAIINDDGQGAEIRIEFSHAVNCQSLQEAFSLKKNGSDSPLEGEFGSCTETATALRFTPNAPLSYGTDYTVQITSDALDKYSNPLGETIEWSFTTGAEPQAVNIATSDGSLTNAGNSVIIEISFDQPMSCEQKDTHISLSNMEGSVHCTEGGTGMTFVPKTVLAYNTTYTVTVEKGMLSAIGNPTSSKKSFQFTTQLKPPILSYADWDADWVKAIKFEWDDVTGANYYRLLEQKDHGTGWDVVDGFDAIPNDQLEARIADISVHLYDWNPNHIYRLEACKAADECSRMSNEQYAKDAMLDAIGYIKAYPYPEQGCSFGWSAALNRAGSLLAVGEPSSGRYGYDNSGAVHIYRRGNHSDWGEWAPYEANRPLTGETDSLFGASLDFTRDGRVLAVGAPKLSRNEIAGGGVFVYQLEDEYLISNTKTLLSPVQELDDDFGHAIEFSREGAVLAVSAPNEAGGIAGICDTSVQCVGLQDNSKDDSGAVYIYSRIDEYNWGQPIYIKAPNVDDYDRFGWSLAISDDGTTLAVGAPYESGGGGICNDPQQCLMINDNDMAASGAVYIYQYVNGIWEMQAYLKSDDPQSGDRFGLSVAMSGDGKKVVVGSPFRDVSAIGETLSDAGKVYIFRNSGSAWEQTTAIVPDDRDSNNWFGWALALSSNGERLVVGSPGENSGSVGVVGVLALDVDSKDESGAAYFYSLTDGAIKDSQVKIKASNSGYNDRFGGQVPFLFINGGISINEDGSTMAISAPYESGNSSGINGDRSDDEKIIAGAGAVYLY